MNRAEAIQSIIDKHSEALFIMSNGLTSREASYYCPNESSFYLLHAMGEGLSVGIGVASARIDLEVVVIEGDGNALMGAASWAMNRYDNLHHYVLVNETYETTGGQQLPPNIDWPPWCRTIEIDKQNGTNSPNPPSPEIIWSDVQLWLSSEKGKTL
jgi:thiamine pyrophosphate-dependent acetolactate synthase large subunit-like protein